MGFIGGTDMTLGEIATLRTYRPADDVEGLVNSTYGMTEDVNDGLAASHLQLVLKTRGCNMAMPYRCFSRLEVVP